jgi:hypothetical protein
MKSLVQSSKITRKRKVSELSIPQGFENGPVKCKKIRQPYHPPELFTLHALMGFIGMRGSGKTHAMVNLTKKYLEEGSFNRIFIISPTYHSNPIFHVLKAKDEDVYTDPQTSQHALNDILRKTAVDAKEYDDFETYLNAYKKFRDRKELTTAEHTLLQNQNFKKPVHIPVPRPCLLIDDMSHSDIYSTSRHNPFINLCLRHRHVNNGKGITIMMAAQTFLTGLPKALRQNVTQLFIWPTKDETQLMAIYHEVANLVDKENFMTLYEKATRTPHSFLTIDNNAPHPSLQFRKNFNVFLIPSKHNLLEKTNDHAESR